MTLERCNSQSCGQKIFKFKICHRKHHKKMVVISKNYFQKKFLPLKFCLFWTSFSHSALTGKYLRSDHARAPRSTLKLSGLDLGALAWSLDNFTFDHARAPTSTLYHIEWILVSWHDHDHAMAPRATLLGLVWILVPWHDRGPKYIFFSQNYRRYKSCPKTPTNSDKKYMLPILTNHLVIIKRGTLLILYLCSLIGPIKLK